jgi:transposase-like protein
MSQDQENAATQTVPDPEVEMRAKRRQFSAQDKLRILNEADSCSESGQIGALVRREGIYWSYLTDWRRELENGQLQGLQARKRGRPSDEQSREVRELRSENEQLKAQLAQAELIISAQKKLAQALEQTLSRNKGN